jgi:sugar phosphate isomerase/epimerase
MTTNPAAAAVENAEPQILLGTAPDSWGVWFDRDPHQVEWKQYLDEAGAAGYVWTELGPYEFLPADPAQLSDELDARGLKPSGGAVFAGLHNGPEALQKELEDCREECQPLPALGAKYLVLLPPQCTCTRARRPSPGTSSPSSGTPSPAGWTRSGAPARDRR